MTGEAEPTKVKRKGFPTRHLATGERILWDGRPSIIVYFLRSLLLLLFGIALGVLAWAQSDITIDLAFFSTYVYILIMIVLALLMTGVHRKWGILEAAIGVVVILLVVLNVDITPLVYFIPMAVGLIAFLIEYIVWSHTYFAISDRRIMTQYGVFNLMFADTQIDRVQNVTVVQPLLERVLGYGDIMFATAGEMGGIKSDDTKERMRAGGAIVWENIPRPFEVRKIAEDIIFRMVRSQQPLQQTYVQQVVPVPAPVQQVLPVEAEERLTKLNELLGKGLISSEEYEQKRKEILGQV
jgi:membrane protein YdbS with pleckstrin-like domain